MKIQTYVNAWDGYLAFGLWYSPYTSTSFSLTPDAYLVVMTTKGQLLALRTTKGEIHLSNFMATVNFVEELTGAFFSRLF